MSILDNLAPQSAFEPDRRWREACALIDEHGTWPLPEGVPSPLVPVPVPLSDALRKLSRDFYAVSGAPDEFKSPFNWFEDGRPPPLYDREA